MIIGYARVSTQDQNLDLQIDDLKKAGCEKIYTDKISGTTTDRPGLDRAKEALRKGDILVVWRLDRLGRSLKNLIEWVSWFEKEGVAFKSVKETIDTSTPTGKLIFHIFGGLAEFERNLIQDRTHSGLAAARARGKIGGRKEVLTLEQKTTMREIYKKADLPVMTICKQFKISKPTFYKAINEKR